MYLLRQFNRGTLIALAFSIVITSTVSAGPGNYNQQGPKLVGSGAMGNDQQGTSIAVSADGNTALSSGLGGVWAFVRSNGTWTQQGPKLIGSVAGGNVALSSDGNTAVVGSANNSTFVFTRSAGVWTQQGNALIGTGELGAGHGFAGIVAVSGDGNTLAEAGPIGVTTGAVWVFVRSGGAWTQQGSSLISPDGLQIQFGVGVALSYDGNTLAVGYRNNASDDGAVVFTRSNGVWAPQGGALSTAPPLCGISGNSMTCPQSGVNLTPDGNTILIDQWFFYRNNGVWSQKVGPFTNPIFGEYGYRLSPDGDTIGAAVCCVDNQRLRVFVRDGGGWKLQHEYTGNFAPTPVAFSRNGNTMIMGEPLDNNSLGALLVFATPELSTSLTHQGSFHRGQLDATYTMTVTNIGDRDVRAAQESAVNVVDKVPSGLTATDIHGAGWSCTLMTVSCSRDDGLPVGASFPPITVTVTVASNAPASVINLATASGGGSNWGNAKDPTTIVP